MKKFIRNLCVMAAIAFVPSVVHGQTLRACYNPSGTVYVIGVPGAPLSCSSPSHTEISWNVVGPRGPAGAAGEAGAAGVPGVAGVVGPVGPRGRDGAAGPAGEAGGAGTPGIAGVPGPAGEPGKPGPKGVEGPRGPQGLRGATGAPGVAGADGAAGVDGTDGRDAYAQITRRAQTFTLTAATYTEGADASQAMFCGQNEVALTGGMSTIAGENNLVTARPLSGAFFVRFRPGPLPYTYEVWVLCARAITQEP